MAQVAKKAARFFEGDEYKRRLAARIYQAFDDFNRKQGRGRGISQGELGERVAKRLKLSKPIAQAAVSRWMSESNPATPDNPTLWALSIELGVDLMWLTYGAAED